MGRQFKDQILWLGRVWETWNEAEKVVALYSVIRKLSPISTHFLLNILSQNVPSESVELAAAEARANDSAWVSRIPESYDGGTTDLLQHLPLLRSSNADAKTQYLSVIPKVLSQALSQPVVQPNTLEKARQLLSYSLIHPALSGDERKSLVSWIKSLEEKLQSIQVDHCDGFSYEPGDEETEDGDNGKGLGTIESSPICTSSPSNEDKTKWNGVNVSHEQLKEDIRWTFLDSTQNHCVMSPKSGSGSDSVVEESGSCHPRMKGVALWLKSLRLHKYANILCNLTFEEMMNLTEEILEAKGVTKGARHKIVISVAKLKGRREQLESIEKDIMQGGSIPTALNQLKSLVNTLLIPSQDYKPFQIPNEENPTDFPSHFTRVMGKVCTQMQFCAKHEDECMTMFLTLVEKCMPIEALSDIHKRRLFFWKQQILKLWHPPRCKEQWHNRRWSHQYPSEMNSSYRRNQQRYSAPTTHVPKNWQFYQPLVQQQLMPRTTFGVNASLLSPQHFFAKRPSLQETASALRPHATLQRTRSAPSRPNHVLSVNQSVRPKAPPFQTSDKVPVQQDDMCEPDMTSLESLCRSMTEHALG